MKQNIFIVFTLLFLLGAYFFGTSVHKNMNEFKELKKLYADELNLNETLFDIKEYISATEVERTEMSSGVILNKAKLAEKRSWNNSLYLLIISIGYFIGVLFMLQGKLIDLKLFGISLLALSIVFLVLGVFIPMLEMSVYLNGVNLQADFNLNEIPLIGDWLPDKEIDLSQKINGKMYAYYQSKSITDLIQILFQSKNYVVGVAILLFSFIFPVLKLCFSFLFILSKSARNKTLFVNTVSYIGKFSMADVFVVAIFLAFFSINNINTGVTTEGNVLVGMYLFLTYCILSILVFLVIKRLLKKDISVRNMDTKPTINQEILN